MSYKNRYLSKYNTKNSKCVNISVSGHCKNENCKISLTEIEIENGGYCSICKDNPNRKMGKMDKFEGQYHPLQLITAKIVKLESRNNE